MTVRFPDEPGFQGRFAPVRLEGEIRGVEVTQGEIPASLHGTFYRVGADPAWPPLAERDFYGPDELLANAPRLWPDTTTLPFHYRHPVTGKEFVADSWGAFPEP
jgi:hypothetical protein